VIFERTCSLINKNFFNYFYDVEQKQAKYVNIANVIVWTIVYLLHVDPIMFVSLFFIGTPTLITNGIGVLIMGIYLAAYIRFCKHSTQRLVIIILVLEVVSVTTFATLALGFIESLGLR